MQLDFTKYLKDAYLARGFVVAFVVTGLLLGILAFYMRCRRNRKGSGMSQMPPIIFAAAWFPAVISEPTLIFSQTGFTVLRVLEALVSAAALMGAMILLECIIPSELADRFCCRKDPEHSDGDQ